MKLQENCSFILKKRILLTPEDILRSMKLQPPDILNLEANNSKCRYLGPVCFEHTSGRTMSVISEARGD